MILFHVTGGEKEQDRTLQSHDDRRGGVLNKDDILKSASFQLRPQSNGNKEEETKLKFTSFRLTDIAPEKAVSRELQGDVVYLS
jgi:hypothetical protein